MRRIRGIIRPVMISAICLLLMLNGGMAAGVFAEGDSDPVEEVTALLEGIDSLQQMQNKRGEFTVTTTYDAGNPESVSEHEAAQAGYKAYVEDMFAKRAEAQAAYDALTEEQKGQIDPALLAKLTDTLGTTFGTEAYPLTPSTNEYNYQILMISKAYYLAYELSMHSSQDLDMPCTLMIADVSGDATSIIPDGEYSYGNNNYELTYCCDEREPTVFKAHYKRINLEDCTYYNSFQASKIRAIVLNSYPFVPLDEMKAALKAAGVECADELDRSDVVAAVQFAIWYYSNKMTNGQISADTSYGYTANAIAYKAGGNRPLITSYHDYRNELWYWWNANNYRDWAYDEDADERVTALFDYLIALPGVEAADNQSVISDVKISRTGAADQGDGTYSVGLNIMLNHGAAAADNVTITISSPTETKTIDVTGETQYSTTIKAKYDETVTVTVEGTQELDKGVYFYEPEGGYDASQSLVGVAEGETRIKAEDSFVFTRDVESGLHIYKTEEESGKPLEGIVFSVYDVTGKPVSDIPTDSEIADYAVSENLAGTMTTDNTGYAAIELPYGTYLVIEEPNDKVKKPADPFYVTLPLDGEDVAELNLVNREREEPGTATIELEAKKEFNDWGKARSFTFVLEAVTHGAPMPDSATAVATESAKTAVFPEILYREPGTYEYTITEVNDGVPGVSYDTTPHRVVVTVTEEKTVENEGDYLLTSYSLEAEASYDGSGSLIITNTYSPAKAQIEVSKLLQGREWQDADRFIVKLTAASQDAPMPKTDELVLTRQAQTGSFGPIAFEQAGTYEYIVTETPGNEAGMTYDAAEHKVTVTVTRADDATNALNASVAYGDGKTVVIKNYKNGEPPTGDDTDLKKPLLMFGGAFLAILLLLLLKLRKRGN